MEHRTEYVWNAAKASNDLDEGVIVGLIASTDENSQDYVGMEFDWLFRLMMFF